MKLDQMLVNWALNQFEDGQTPKPVVIFGAGRNGLWLKSFLQQTNINIAFFCDNSPEKQGTEIDGIPCVAVEELSRYKNEVIIFVSPIKSEAIMEQLRDYGFTCVISHDFLKLAKYIPYSDNENDFLNFPPIGHYYSLYPDIEEIKKKSEEIFQSNKELLDIDFNEEEQLSMLNQMIDLYPSIPKWPDSSVKLGSTPLRYRFGNPSLSAGDAVGLHCMLRILKPKKMIEVGSGYTSAVTLDTNEFYMKDSIELTFIEPYPNVLESILKETDRINLMKKGLQDVPLQHFEELDDGDILFIDSTHVSKINSDVNYLFFEILPRLKKGVYIHLHDIFYPFEYPRQWIMDGMIWNELYLLRAFLQNNKKYSIQFFQNMMEQKYQEIFKSQWPMREHYHGGSFWMRKLD
ncbi:class I SAM-dependent methyltransferase [Paenibacillus sp. sgz500958]|uniref:class I SAM-dependent methyltransferase n=1 Tax=Paenibacillus sp. sgz500958 TaxID=3242475 RepID=UPI0036D41942